MSIEHLIAKTNCVLWKNIHLPHLTRSLASPVFSFDGVDWYFEVTCSWGQKNNTGFGSGSEENWKFRMVPSKHAKSSDSYIVRQYVEKSGKYFHIAEKLGNPVWRSFLSNTIEMKNDMITVLFVISLDSLTTPVDFLEYDSVRKYDNATTCGLKWTPNSVAYRCLTCGISPEMSLCPDCFQGGNHEGHDFNTYRSHAGGFCDCGDKKLMKESGFCQRHSLQSQINKPEAPSDLLSVAEVLMPRLFSRLVQHLRNNNESVRKYDNATTCGLKWTANFVAYRCRTCGISPKMSLCPDCFQRGNHEGHDFNTYRSHAGGSCDCGDKKLMKESGFCQRHGPQNQINKPEAPPDLLSVAEVLMPGLFSRLVQHLRDNSESGNMDRYSVISKADAFINMLLFHSEMGSAMTQALTNPQLYYQLAVNKELTEKLSIEGLAKDIGQLFNKNEYSDATLKCGKKSFAVHRSILAARSEVFSAMFHHDMAEKNTGIVNIEDLDSDILELFLRYLYSGNIEKMSINVALELYQVADKYSVNALKKFSASYILNNMSEAIVCDVLLLADQASDTEFLDNVATFAAKIQGFLKTSQWEEFAAKFPTVAIKVYSKFCHRQ